MLDAVFEWLVDRLSTKGDKDRGVLVLRRLFFGGLVLGAAVVLLAFLTG